MFSHRELDVAKTVAIDPPAQPMQALLACLRHEINNQLAILAGRSELLELDVAHEPHLAADVKVIRDATVRSMRSVRSLLDLVAPIGGPLVAMPMANLLDGALEVLARPLGNRGIIVQWCSLDRAVQVRGVKTDMEQAALFAVFYAMLALEASPPGQRTLGIAMVLHGATDAGEAETVAMAVGGADAQATLQTVPSLSDGVQRVQAALARNGGHFSVEGKAPAVHLQLTLPANRMF